MTSAVEESDVFDLIVVGGGMAGLTAGAMAAEAGASVLLVERADDVGGNAAVSGGYVWTLRSEEQTKAASPDADPQLRAAAFHAFPDVVEWMRRRGATLSGPLAVMTHGRGYLLDMASYLASCVRSLESHGGAILRQAEVTELIVESGSVRGVRLRGDDGTSEVRARYTLLATGGFQADPDLRDKYFGQGGRDLRLRSSPFSRGDGLRLALAAGGVFTSGNSGFYGHLTPSGVSLQDRSRMRNVSLFHSEHSLVLDRSGSRMTDESVGDEVTNQALFRAGGQALLLWDEWVQREVVLRPYPPGSPGEDRFELVRANGGSGVTAGSLPSLATAVAEWGWDAAGIVAEVERYNSLVETAPERLTPVRMWNARRLDEPPYYAVLCDASVTFPHGGIRFDSGARVLDESGNPIPGLLVAGCDGGDVMRGGYSGALSHAASFAMLACRTAGFVKG